MFTIISIMFVGIGIGYVLRNLQFLQYLYLLLVDYQCYTL